MESRGYKLYITVIELDAIYNFVVYNFSIEWILEAQIFIFKLSDFEIQISEFLNDLRCWHGLY
jgi:hypothetical protein